LLAHVVIQQRLFELVNSGADLMGQGQDLEPNPNPNQHGAGNVVALDSSFAALAFVNAGGLFQLAVHLLNVPSDLARLLGKVGGRLSGGFRLPGLPSVDSADISHHILRPLGGQRQAEQVQVEILGKVLDDLSRCVGMDAFAV